MRQTNNRTERENIKIVCLIKNFLLYKKQNLRNNCKGKGYVLKPKTNILYAIKFSVKTTMLSYRQK